MFFSWGLFSSRSTEKEKKEVMHDVVGRSAEERRLRRATRWLVRFPRAIPILLFLIIAIFTAFSVLAIERSEERRERIVISEFAQTIAIDLDRRGN